MSMLKAEEITYAQVRELDKSKTICFLPVSALEVHGPHLPLGMDFYMARWMAEESGRRFVAAHDDWNAIQYPVLPLGTDELPLDGSMHADQSTVYNAVYSHGASLADAGFRYVVVTNGHGGPRHAAALESACRNVSRDKGIQMFSPSIAVLHAIITGKHLDFVEEKLGRPLSEAEREGLLCGEHAGAWETSFMLSQNADLVDPGYQHLEKCAPPPLRPFLTAGNKVIAFQENRGDDTAKTRTIVESLAGGLGWLLNTKHGYGGPAVSYKGTPAVASAAIGNIFRHLLARECLAYIEDVTSGKKSAEDVRSLASDPIVIQPHLWSSLGYAAAAAAGILILIL